MAFPPLVDRPSVSRRVATAVVAAVCLVLGPLANVPAQAADTASISGTVVDSRSGDPLPAAVVLVRPADDDDASPMTVDADARGVFAVTGLAAGEYTAEFRDVSGQHLAEFYSDAHDIGSATVVAVTEGQSRSLGDVGLDEGATLSGVVQTVDPAQPDTGRVAVADATVTALPVGGQVDPTELVPTTTDASGRYALTHLPAGTYKIRVSAPDYFDAYSGSRASEQDAAEMVLGVGQAGTADPILVDRAASITGTVTDQAGEPVDAVSVDAYAVVGGVVGAEPVVRSVSDRNGVYVFPRVRAGTYQLRFSGATGPFRERTEIRVEGGEPAHAEPVALSPVPVAAPVVPPAPYAPPAASPRRSATVKVSAKGARKKATLKISVTARGVTPTGRITIRLGSKKLKTVTLKRGRATVTLTRQKKGKRTYTIVYSGNGMVRAKTVNSKKVAIR
jgi:hypothetical protein